MSDNAKDYPAPPNRIGPRPLTVDDATRLFNALSSAMGQEPIETRQDCEDLTQQLMFMIDQHQRNERRFADEVFRWRHELPGGFSEHFFQLRTSVEEKLQEHDEGHIAHISRDFNTLYQHYKHIYGELTSFLHSSRYEITAYKKGVPQAESRLKLLRVLDGKKGAINLHIDDKG